MQRDCRHNLRRSGFENTLEIEERRRLKLEVRSQNLEVRTSKTRVWRSKKGSRTEKGRGKERERNREKTNVNSQKNLINKIYLL